MSRFVYLLCRGAFHAGRRAAARVRLSPRWVPRLARPRHAPCLPAPGPPQSNHRLRGRENARGDPPAGAGALRHARGEPPGRHPRLALGRGRAAPGRHGRKPRNSPGRAGPGPGRGARVESPRLLGALRAALPVPAAIPLGHGVPTPRQRAVGGVPARAAGVARRGTLQPPRRLPRAGGFPARGRGAGRARGPTRGRRWGVGAVLRPAGVQLHAGGAPGPAHGGGAGAYRRPNRRTRALAGGDLPAGRSPPGRDGDDHHRRGGTDARAADTGHQRRRRATGARRAGGLVLGAQPLENSPAAVPAGQLQARGGDRRAWPPTDWSLFAWWSARPIGSGTR